MYDYVQYLHGFSSSQNATATASLAHTDDPVKFFQKYLNGDSAITVARQLVIDFSAKLSSGIGSYTLDPRAERA